MQQQATLCFLIKKDQDSSRVLLGMKKRGFGEGKFNGYGGKPDEGETIEQTTIREMQEESGVIIKQENMKKLAELNFAFPIKKEWDQTVHVFVVEEWENNPVETEEMKPQWFKFEELPFHSMWDDDKYWLPLVLEGKKIEADFFFEEDNNTIKKHEIREK